MKAVVFSADGRLNTKDKRLEECSKSAEFENYPSSYFENTTKEELCAEYVNKFIDQYAAINPKRRRPYMMALNEFGVQKFVCSTLRPTQLQYTELYDMYECAVFLAGYILYEPLNNPIEPPHALPSPLKTLTWHTGDCFDMAILLCSLLLGSGYDAYVVYGYAPKFICLRDQSRTECPLASYLTETPATDNNDVDENEEDKEDNTYRPLNNAIRESKYVADQKERKRIEGLDTFILWASDENKNDLKPVDDSIKRVHAWVLVRAGRRDVREHVFLEPSTGRSYQTSNSPYVGIEAVWNHLNYWVNMNLEKRVSNVSTPHTSTPHIYIYR